MADWFKFYENCLDEPRFAIAIAELPEVLPVWVLILCEHCRLKSASIPWGDEFQLRGLARKVNVPLDKFTQATTLLQSIKYIAIRDGQLTTLRWSDRQSEYCQWKTRQKRKSVLRVSRECPESVPLRGEEKRGEESKSLKALPAKTRKVQSPIRDGELMGRLRRLLGDAAMVNDGGKWRNRCRTNPSKVCRVLDEAESKKKEGFHIIVPAAWLEDLWKRFA